MDLKHIDESEASDLFEMIDKQCIEKGVLAEGVLPYWKVDFHDYSTIRDINSNKEGRRFATPELYRLFRDGVSYPTPGVE